MSRAVVYTYLFSPVKAVLMDLRFIPFIVMLLMTVSGCVKQPASSFKQPSSISLNLAMPTNVYVGTDLAPLVYHGLWDHFRRVGYQMRSPDAADYSLSCKILSNTVVNQFANPGLLAYATRFKLTLSCAITQQDGKLLAEKKFSTYALVNQPLNPVHKGAYYDYAVKQAMALLAPRIDYYLRKQIT